MIDDKIEITFKNSGVFVSPALVFTTLTFSFNFKALATSRTALQGGLVGDMYKSMLVVSEMKRLVVMMVSHVLILFL